MLFWLFRCAVANEMLLGSCRLWEYNKKSAKVTE